MGLIGYDAVRDTKKWIAGLRKRVAPLAAADAAIAAANAAQRAARERHEAATRGVNAAAAALARGEVKQSDVDAALCAEAEAERAADPRIFAEQRRAPENVKRDSAGVLAEIEAEIATYVRERVDIIRAELGQEVERRILEEIEQPLATLHDTRGPYGSPIASAALGLRELGALRSALPGCLYGLGRGPSVTYEDGVPVDPHGRDERQRAAVAEARERAEREGWGYQGIGADEGAGAEEGSR